MGRKRSNKNYFTLETEAKIIEYNNTKDDEVRSKIYKEHIHLVEKYQKNQTN